MMTNRLIHGYEEADRKDAVSRWLMRVWLTALMLCCLPITDFGARARTEAHGESIKKECVTRHDGLQRHLMQERQSSLAGAVITAKT